MVLLVLALKRVLVRYTAGVAARAASLQEHGITAALVQLTMEAVWLPFWYGKGAALMKVGVARELNRLQPVPRWLTVVGVPIPLPDGARRLPSMALKAAFARSWTSVTSIVRAIPFRGGNEPAMHELRRKIASQQLFYHSFLFFFFLHVPVKAVQCLYLKTSEDAFIQVFPVLSSISNIIILLWTRRGSRGEMAGGGYLLSGAPRWKLTFERRSTGGVCKE
jgi:hypothetical protein